MVVVISIFGFIKNTSWSFVMKTITYIHQPIYLAAPYLHISTLISVPTSIVGLR